jgi:hypothetical protein
MLKKILFVIVASGVFGAGFGVVGAFSTHLIGMDTLSQYFLTMALTGLMLMLLVLVGAVIYMVWYELIYPQRSKAK